MKPTFKQLRSKLSHPQVKELLNLSNKRIGRIWQRNYSELQNLLHEHNYEGSLDYTHLETFINSLNEKNEQQKRADNELFSKLSSMKTQKKQQKKQRKAYKQSIKDAANTQRELMNINYDSAIAKTENREAYEASLNRAQNKTFFKNSLQDFVQRLKRNENINVDASNNEDLKQIMRTLNLHLLKPLEPSRIKTSSELRNMHT